MVTSFPESFACLTAALGGCYLVMQHSTPIIASAVMKIGLSAAQPGFHWNKRSYAPPLPPV